jgi:tRNA (guanine26-N2/guanine27-N2)-dimethyltransferase
MESQNDSGCSEGQTIPEGFTVICEGKAKILMKANEVFYNPVQEFNRDLSILIIRQFLEQYNKEKEFNEKTISLKEDPEISATNTNNNNNKANANPSTSRAATTEHEHNSKRPICVLEALSATGLRAIRYFKEIPGLDFVVANDISDDAVAAIRRNVAFNGLSTLQVRVNHEDANLLMCRHKKPAERFTVVDLDPYGAPIEFLDTAVQAVAEGGLLCVTCTDLSVLCGNHCEACYAKYGVMPLRGTKYCHEMALRIALAAIQAHAARHKRIVVPLLSIYADFYIRIFLRLYTSGQETKKVASKMSYIYQCSQCSTFWLQPVCKIQGEEPHLKYSPASGPPVGPSCAFCGGTHKIGGPIWAAPIHDGAFLEKCITFLNRPESRQLFKTHKRMLGLLSVAAEVICSYSLVFLDSLSVTVSFVLGVAGRASLLYD